MFYYEQSTFDKRWAPVKTISQPQIGKDGRIKRSLSVGPVIRAVQEISRGHENLTLDQLRAIYSPDGREST